MHALLKNTFLFAALAVALKTGAQQSAVFPQPNGITYSNDEFYALADKIRYVPTPEAIAVIPIVAGQFRLCNQLEFETVSGIAAPTDLVFEKKTELATEHYTLTIDRKGIKITYGDKSGLLYALQTLDQLIERRNQTIVLKGITIEDGPEFAWRGAHLDCARHFFTIGEIKGFLDQLLALKMNTFHWHLTDDQGWRLEIRQYPKLTEIGAWRDSTIVGHYSRTPREYDHVHYGGFYTQQEAKEIVKYATDRGITVIPEIELPGHARAALAAYPELGCTGEQLPVPGLWGVFDDVFCSQPETIRFLQNVLEEVIAIFPSETIHIGGDECPKVRWDACPKCKLVREQNGLKDSHELQSWFIGQMDDFLRAKGRKLMGWDEILEGGLATNAQVMSWRGTEGGIAAAKQGHPVVMTPTAYCYFDYYQSGHPDEPLAIGGFLPLEKVYSFNPVPAGLSAEEQKYILGGQANLWTEYIVEMKDVQYSAFPRLVAMAQVLWTKGQPSYADFAQQLTEHYLPRLKKSGINYSTAFLDPQLIPAQTVDGIRYAIEPPFKSITAIPGFIALQRVAGDVHTDSVVVSAKYDGVRIRSASYVFISHPIVGIPVQLITPPSAKYNNHGELALTDGIRGKRPWKGDQWLGFSNDTVQFAIDLGELRSFGTIELGCLDDPGSWIYLPKKIVVETSADGKKFRQEKMQAVTSETVCITKKTKARFVRITLVNDTLIPEGSPGAGTTPWTFIDELIIR